MIDINLLKHDFDNTIKKLSYRNYVLDIKKFNKYEKIRKNLQKITEKLQSARNIKSKEIGMIKSTGENIYSYCKDVKKIGEKIEKLKIELNKVKNKILNYMLDLPNLPMEGIPIGYNYSDNLEVYKWGAPKNYNFKIKDHVSLGNTSSSFDFYSASKLIKSRFVVMKNEIAKLHRALIQFMLNTHIDNHGYTEYYVPYIVNKNSLIGTGQLPKFSKDLFNVLLKEKNNEYYLIPTGEVPLLNIKRNEIIEENSLPLKMVTHTPCFRAEHLSYGKDIKGLIRMHQFEKVEIVQIVKPEKSNQALEEITGHAEKILELLKLPYRKLLLCTGDMSFSSCKTYDLEVWLPSQNMYREISSCSNTGDFQARRMKIRYRNKNNKKINLVHTLNGSGLAVSRTLAAVMENNQLSNGRIEVPEILRKYMNGIKYI